MKLYLKQFIFNNNKTNSYLVWNDLHDSIMIDPACSNREEERELELFIAEKELYPKDLLITHAHFDHTIGIPFMKRNYSAKCWLHPDDEKEIAMTEILASIHGSQKVKFSIDYQLEDEQHLMIGDIEVRVIHIPGHTEGSVCFYLPAGPFLFTGDTMVKGSLGFVNSAYSELLQYVEKKVCPLSDNTMLYFGHGSSSILAIERKDNPFFRRIAEGRGLL